MVQFAVQRLSATPRPITISKSLSRSGIFCSVFLFHFRKLIGCPVSTEPSIINLDCWAPQPSLSEIRLPGTDRQSTIGKQVYLFEPPEPKNVYVDWIAKSER